MDNANADDQLSTDTDGHHDKRDDPNNFKTTFRNHGKVQNQVGGEQRIGGSIYYGPVYQNTYHDPRGIDRPVGGASHGSTGTGTSSHGSIGTENIISESDMLKIKALAQNCIGPSFKTVRQYPTAASEALWESFCNTFAYDSWITFPKLYSLNAGDITLGLKTLVCDLATSDPNSVPSNDIGLALAVHLSSAAVKTGKVIYSRCEPRKNRIGLGLYSFESGRSGFEDCIGDGLRAALAQLVFSIHRDSNDDYYCTEDTSPWSALLNTSSTLLELARGLDYVSGFIKEPVTIVLSFAGQNPVGEDPINLDDVIRGVEESVRSRNNWRILFEGPLVSNIIVRVDCDTEYKGCLSRLRFDEIDFYIERIPPAWPGTNNWLFEHSKLKQWVAADSGILWIQGKPGSGKSVLSRTIVERGRSGQITDAKAMNFWSAPHRWTYSRRFEDVYTNHAFMLRSLVFQTLKSDKKSFNCVRKFWRKKRYTLIEDNHILDFQQILRILVQNLQNTLLLVIDGFDEGELSSSNQLNSQDIGREAILQFITELVSTNSLLKFIILSRPEADIERVLSEHPDCFTIVLQHENDSDIKALVDGQLTALTKALTSKPSQRSGRIAQSPRVTNLIRRGRVYNREKSATNVHKAKGPVDRIREYIARHAHGVFLWVNLIFKELHHLMLHGLVSWNDIEIVIKGLPTDLINMYKDILKDLLSRHPPAATEKARKAMEWVFVASTLNSNFALQVLREALSIPSANNALNLEREADPFEAFQPLFHETWSDYRRSLYQLCGPFIDVVRPKSDDPEIFGPFDHVQLVHTTARDFLATAQAGEFRYSLTGSHQRVKDEINHYLFLALPHQETRYCPIPADASRHWETILADTIEYFEDKPLISFVLSAFPGLRSGLPEWTTDIGMAAIPPGFLEHRSSTQVVSQKQSLIQYAQTFYLQKDLSTEHSKSAQVYYQHVMAYALIGKIFCDSCMTGSVTAVGVLAALMPRKEDSRRDDSILNGALIAAICQRLKADAVDLFRYSPKDSDSVEEATPYLNLALQHSDTETFDALYEIVFKTSTESDVHSRLNQSDAQYLEAKSSWMEKHAKFPDPLRMLVHKPHFSLANQELTAACITVVMLHFFPETLWNERYPHYEEY